MTPSSSGSTSTRHQSMLNAAQLATLRRLLEAERATVLERATVFVDESGQIDPTSATHGRGETEHTTVDIERRVSEVLEAQARHDVRR